jgi:hypothetical protein
MSLPKISKNPRDRDYRRTCHPTATWVTQQARQLTWNVAEGQESFRFMSRDRDQKFTDCFDEEFRSVGMEWSGRRFALLKQLAWRSGLCERFAQSVSIGC